MTQEIRKIMGEVKKNVNLILSGLKYDVPESQLNKYRGTIEGLLKAAEIITGDEWNWEADGVYRNHGNEPEIKW